MTTVWKQTEDQIITFTTCYRPPDHSKFHSEIEDMISSFRLINISGINNRLSLIVCLDFSTVMMIINSAFVA